MKVSFKAVAGALTAISMALLITACEPPTGGTPTPGGTTAKLTSLTLSPTAVSMVVGGVSVDTKAVKVTGHYDDDTTAPITDATWTSSAESVATVSQGTITAVAVGTATITATSGEKSATVDVTVTSASITNDHSVVLASGTPDLSYAGDPWDSGSTITWDDTSDTTYGHQVLAASGTGWGVAATATAFTGLTAGNLKNYEHLNFKVKSSTYTAVRVSFPGATTPEIEYTFASGTQLPGDWIQMSIPLADFGTIPITLTQFGILNKVGAGGYALTDVGFTGSVAVDASSLTAAITSAQSALAAHPVGTAGGEVSQSVHDDYNTAITAAVAASKSTWESVAATLATLNTATSAFFATLTPSSVPATPAATPVISLFNSSAHYTDISMSAWQTGWSSSATMVADTNSVSPKTLMKLSFTSTTGYAGAETAALQDISALTGKKLHLDYFTYNGGGFAVKVVDFSAGSYNGGVGLVDTGALSVGTIVQGAWTSVDLDVSGLTDSQYIAQLVFAATGAVASQDIWIDNVYFH